MATDTAIVAQADSAQGPAAPGISSSGSSRAHLLLLVALWVAVFAAALFGPPLLDDADATHANAARHIVESGDLVTLRVNGVRYLEKAPLPYWLVAVCFALFGFNTFAAHLPLALGVLALALLGYRWGQQAYGERAGLYTGLATLTSAGVFLFTRVLVPEVLLSLFLAAALYASLRALQTGRAAWFYTVYALVALGVLTKGLIAIVFFGGTALLFLALTGHWRRWRELRIPSGTLLFLAIAAPWHILAGLRNTGGYQGHGFFWFYFVNEHFLRFLGRRIPHDYNKLPGTLYWTLHLVWLFPWSLFAPAAAVAAWWRRDRLQGLRLDFAGQTTLSLAIFAGLILLFFSISTNQEYYTFPAYGPLLLLGAAGLAAAERDKNTRRWIVGAHMALVVLGAAIAITLFSGLWSSRKLPFVADIGSLLAHRGVGDYTLSMSHFFDLTGPSFAALRLPASLAALAFTVGPSIAFMLRRRRRDEASTIAIAVTAAAFLIAAHLALVRFAPMLSSAAFAERFRSLESTGQLEPGSQLMLYGDQSYGSSVAFYTGRVLPLVEGRSSSMWFGSTFSDAPAIFLTDAGLRSGWGKGVRKVLFVPLEQRDAVDAVLGRQQITLMELSGKVLLTDRPLLAPVRPAFH